MTDEQFVKIGTRIEQPSDCTRIDSYLAHKYPFLSRVKWQKRINHGEIRVTSADYKIKPKLKVTYQLQKYDQIWYYNNDKEEDIPFQKIDIIHDDGDVCIFSKPPHMVVHPVGIYGKNNFLTHIQRMGYEDCAPVHRIDRETSGILVCARKSRTRAEISKLFRENKIKKIYLAVTKGTTDIAIENGDAARREERRVHNAVGGTQATQQRSCIPISDGDGHFTISSPIGTPENSPIRLKLCVNGQNAVPAQTEFHLLAKIDGFHLFACVPKTGRTNQIRIHLASVGHWIVGDKMYHPNENVFLEFYEKGYTDFVHENVLWPRHLLHNAGIFIPGFTNQFIISQIPQDMLDYPIAMELFELSGLKKDLRCLSLSF